MPRAVCSRGANQSPLAKLEVDLTSKAIAERQVDEGEYRDEKGESQTDHRNQQRPVEIAADESDQHGRHDPGLVDLERRVVDGCERHYFSMGTRIELPHSVHDPS